MSAALVRLAIGAGRRRGPPSANVMPRSRVGLGAAPARQIFRLFASRQAQRPLDGGGKIRFDRLSLDLAAEKIRPQKLAERGGPWQNRPLAAARRRGYGTDRPSTAGRSSGCRQNPGGGPARRRDKPSSCDRARSKGVGVERAQVEHNGDENVPQSLFVQRE